VKDTIITSTLAVINIWATLAHLDIALKVFIGLCTAVILAPKAYKQIRAWRNKSQ
jgi:hypothetical protein